MDKETKKALEKSIKKWEDIVSEKGVDKGADNCALCQKFRIDEDCGECPVRLKSRKMFCENTPYDDWTYHQGWYHFYSLSMKNHCPECKTLAEKELEFLKSLR